MRKKIAVSRIVVILVPLVSIVQGQNRSQTTNTQTQQKNSSSISTSYEITGTISKPSTKTIKTSFSPFVMSTANSLNKSTSKNSTSPLLQSVQSKFQSTFFSTIENAHSKFSTYSHSSGDSSQIFISSTFAVNSFISANSSTFNISATFTPSTFLYGSNLYSTDSSTSSLSRKNSVTSTPFVYSSTATKLPNATSRVSLPSARFSTSQGVHSTTTSTHLLSSPMEGNSTQWKSSHSSALITSSPSGRSSFTSAKSLTNTLVPLSASMVVSRTLAVTTITSSRKTSVNNLSSLAKESPTNSSVTSMFSISSTLITSARTHSIRLPMSSLSNTSGKSVNVTFVRPTLSENQTLHTKSSEVKISLNVTTKILPSSAANILSSIFLTINGKLVLSPKSLYSKGYNNFKKLADSIERILDKALQQVNGYIYSKILIITQQDSESKFVCTFKVFIRKPSSETATTLREKINKYNETNGFGEFILHLVETSDVDNQPSTDEKLYMWAIIVIAALGVLCLLLLTAFIYAQRKVKKSRRRNHSSPYHDKNSNQRYSNFFPPVFDGNVEPQSFPLQLTSISSTNSEKPLKFSDTVDTDSEQDDKNEKKSDKSSIGESEKEDDISAVQEQSEPGNAKLQIQDSDDEAKFSTFSRKLK